MTVHVHAVVVGGAGAARTMIRCAMSVVMNYNIYARSIHTSLEHDGWICHCLKAVCLKLGSYVVAPLTEPHCSSTPPPSGSDIPDNDAYFQLSLKTLCHSRTLSTGQEEGKRSFRLLALCQKMARCAVVASSLAPSDGLQLYWISVAPRQACGNALGAFFCFSQSLTFAATTREIASFAVFLHRPNLSLP